MRTPRPRFKVHTPHGHSSAARFRGSQRSRLGPQAKKERTKGPRSPAAPGEGPGAPAVPPIPRPSAARNGGDRTTKWQSLGRGEAPARCRGFLPQPGPASANVVLPAQAPRSSHAAPPRAPGVTCDRVRGRQQRGAFVRAHATFTRPHGPFSVAFLKRGNGWKRRNTAAQGAPQTRGYYGFPTLAALASGHQSEDGRGRDHRAREEGKPRKI